MKNKKKLVIISDQHLGGERVSHDNTFDKELIEFLDHYKKQENIELLILGDFFDLWLVKPENINKVAKVVNERQELFKAFKEFGEKHTVTILAGNHDHELAYKSEFGDVLKQYNFTVDKNQFFIRRFENNNKEFIIIGEHGNQVEPSCAFPDFNMPTESSLAYYLTKVLYEQIMKMGDKGKGMKWLSEIDNIDQDTTAYWAFSKYFYYDVGPILKVFIIPMLFLFSLAIPYFIFNVVTEFFFRPRWLEPLLLFLQTNTLMKIISFILYFDMVIVVILILSSLMKKHFDASLKNYGIQSLSDLLISKEKTYSAHARKVVVGENQFKENADFYVTGHTHFAGLYKDPTDGFTYGDSGSWKQLMKQTEARFNFPPVFVSYFKLSYLVFEVIDNDMVIQLRQWPKIFTPKLTFIERFAIKGKTLPKSTHQDTLVDEIRYPMRTIQLAIST